MFPPASGVPLPGGTDFLTGSGCVCNATSDNAKLPRLFSLAGCLLAEEMDALSAPWSFHRAYAFPPVPLIAEFLQCMALEEVLVLAVLLDWPRRLW